MEFKMRLQSRLTVGEIDGVINDIKMMALKAL